MSTSREYVEFILEQLSELDGIACRKMMGEYIIYYQGRIAAFLCDERMLIKAVPSAVKLMPDADYEPPYEGAKDMILCDNVDDKEFLEKLFKTIYPELPEPNKKTKKGCR